MGSDDEGGSSHSVLQAALHVWNRAGARHTIPVAGWCMWPRLRPGDGVVVQHGRTDIRRGDVIVYRRAGGLIVHRVQRIIPAAAGPLYVTRGDRATRPDPPVPADQIVGRVVAIRRNGRTISVETPAWRLLGPIMAIVMPRLCPALTWFARIGHTFVHRLPSIVP